MAFTNEKVFMGRIPEDYAIGPNSIIETYTITNVPEDNASFFTALMDSLMPYAPTLANRPVQTLRNDVATEIEHHHQLYQPYFPADKTLEETVQQIRDGTSRARVLMMMAIQRTINFKIKIVSEDGSLIIQDHFVSPNPTIWIKKRGAFFQGMVRIHRQVTPEDPER